MEKKPPPAAAVAPIVVKPAAASQPPSGGDPGDYKDKPVAQWSVENVGQWISDLGFEKFKGSFVENCISGEELLELEAIELKADLGISALGARKAIMRGIMRLKT